MKFKWWAPSVFSLLFILPQHLCPGWFIFLKAMTIEEDDD